MNLTKEMLKRMIEEEFHKFLKPDEEDEELLTEDPAEADWCSKRGYYALNRLLKIQNSLAKSAKGDLGKK